MPQNNRTGTLSCAALRPAWQSRDCRHVLYCFLPDAHSAAPTHIGSFLFMCMGDGNLCSQGGFFASAVCAYGSCGVGAWWAQHGQEPVCCQRMVYWGRRVLGRV